MKIYAAVLLIFAVIVGCAFATTNTITINTQVFVNSNKISDVAHTIPGTSVRYRIIDDLFSGSTSVSFGNITNPTFLYISTDKKITGLAYNKTALANVGLGKLPGIDTGSNLTVIDTAGSTNIDTLRWFSPAGDTAHVIILFGK